MSGISKSSVSKLCVRHGPRTDGGPWLTIDERVGAFLGRTLEGEWPCLWLDATDLKVREGGRIVSVAAMVAVAVNTDGRREIVGLHIGPSEAETFWSAFLKSLARRGLTGTKLVISDAHEGLKAAIARSLTGATWQRCRVHFMRNALAHVPRSQTTVVAAAIRQAFVQPDHASATRTWRHVADQLRARWPKLGALMDDAEADVLAYVAFPMRHREPSCTRPTRWSASTRRSSAAPTWSASSPTRTASRGSWARCCSSRTTTGSSSIGTCRSRAWPSSTRLRWRRAPHSRSHPQPPDPMARDHTRNYTTLTDTTAASPRSLLGPMTGTGRSTCRPTGWPTCLGLREQRYVTEQLAFTHQRQRIMLEETELTRRLAGKHVDTYAFPDGRYEVRWKGVPLTYRVFDKDQRVASGVIAERKELGAVLAHIQELQAAAPPKPARRVPINKQATQYQPTGRRDDGWNSKLARRAARRAAEAERRADPGPDP